MLKLPAIKVTHYFYAETLAIIGKVNVFNLPGLNCSAFKSHLNRAMHVSVGISYGKMRSENIDLVELGHVS